MPTTFSYLSKVDGMKTFPLFLLSVSFLLSVNGHAIFWEPPSRASLGQHNANFCKVPVNHDHMSVYCGGISAQHDRNNGKCGICGDPYDAPPDQRPHQAPHGRYATGIIGRSYFEPGQVIDVVIDVTANHGGFFAFALAVNNNPNRDPADQSQFIKLKFADGGDFYPISAKVQRGDRMNVRVKLPDGLTCWQCILQWTYVAGNGWGHGPQMADYHTPECVDPNSPGQMGCGNQETFRGCADICIGPL